MMKPTGVSHRVRQLLALRFMARIAQRFRHGEEPSTAASLSHELAPPVRLVRQVLYDLVSAKLLVEFAGERATEATFQPARAIDGLTVQRILGGLEHAGDEPSMGPIQGDLKSITATLEAFDALVGAAPENVPIDQLAKVR